MRKVLILVGEKLSANGICADAIMQELQNKGYRVICLTNQEYGTIKNETCDDIRIERIKPRLTYRMNSWSNNHNGKVSWVVRKVSFVLNKIKLIISIPTWPLISPIYTYRFYNAAKKLYATENYDCIISIYTQIDTVIAGYFIKKRYPDVKFVPYFLDSLSGGYGPKIFSKAWTLRRGLMWERILLKNADKIIAMESSKKHHEAYSKSERYYSRIKFLDIPLLTQICEKGDSIDILDDNNINFVYVGSIPSHIRNPHYLLEIFKRLNSDNCVLTIIGTNNCPDLISWYQADSVKNKILTKKHISHDQAIAVMRKADFLVNIGNNISTMVPSKIFEYMSIGKPIISTYPIDDEPSLTYLKMYPLALLIKEDWENIDRAVKNVEDFILKNRGKREDYKDLENTMYLNTPQAFTDEIDMFWSKTDKR